MRDVGQPCAQAWSEHGAGAALAVCRARGQLCPEHLTTERDLDGLPQTCALSLWRARLEATRLYPLERDLVVADMRHEVPLKPTAPIAAVEAFLAHSSYERDGVGKLTGREWTLVLGGKPGVGKTVAACVALSRIDHGMPAGRFILADDIIERDAPLKRWSREALLVVDQIGCEWFAKEDEGQWALSQWKKLLVRRHANRLPTILVGNIGRESFAKRYNGVLWDRVRGNGAFLLFEGKSLRGAA